jgi:ligand-binding sensor domain-containing protein/signal transduction histidine kinase
MGHPLKVPAQKPAIVYLNKKEQPSAHPRVVLAGQPIVNTPGQGKFLNPKQVPAISKSILAGPPEVETVKDAYIKDDNQQNFSIFTKRHGLKYSAVHCMMQDRSGNIWFCTYGGGVSKYDGKSFTHFTEKEGLSNNRVWSVMQDRDENIWFGTDGGGACRYDGKYFTRFTEAEGLIGNSVLNMTQDKHGNIWFATTDGVSKFDGKSFTQFTAREGLCDNTILSVLEDKNGNLWFGSGENGVTKFDGKTFVNFSREQGLINNSVLSILQDKDGNLWFGTHRGISEYDGRYFTNYTETEGLAYNDVYHILQDKDGDLWFATHGGGISKLSRENRTPGSSTSLRHFVNYTTADGLSDDVVLYILQDKCNTIWFGTNNGVSKYGGKLFTHLTTREGISNNKVYSIIKDKAGDLWMGTSGGGALRYNGKSVECFSEKEGLCSNKVFCIYQDKDGNIWFGTDGGGVSKYDGSSFTHFSQKNGLPNDKVFTIFQDTDGNMWFGTYGGGISRYNGKCFTNYFIKEGVPQNAIVCSFQDAQKNLWFGTDGGGILKFSPPGKACFNGQPEYQVTNLTKKNGLSSNNIYSIYQDKDGSMWFGTGGGGLIKFDGKYTTTYTEKDGLCSNYILSIFQDKNETLWFGTRFGLCRINSKNKKANANKNEPLSFVSYEYEDGFLGIGCNRSAICQDKTGTIWIGTNDRLTAYHPEGDVADTIPPNIQLTAVDLFNEKINWSDLIVPASQKSGKSEVRDTSIVLENGVTVSNFRFDKTSDWYGLPLNLSLNFDNNFLTFKFIGITQIRNKKVKYQYQLVGLDENWSAPTTTNEVTYGNLSPGHYTFKVKAENSEGFWSNEFEYPFTIRPPWWQTIWFRLGMAAFVVIQLALLYLWRIKSLRKRQKYLERKVAEKTEQVVRQSQELQAINNELIQQKEELEAANATKDKLFSIISHDLRSPFNGFLGLTELMADELEELQLNNMHELAVSMKESASNLYQLLQNLLEWSQLQKGAIKFRPQGCQLRTIAEKCLLILQETARNKKIKLTNNIPADLEVFSDEYMLRTVIQNLVSNALKFSSVGEEVRIDAQQKTDREVTISISDSGIGMSPDLLAKLFRIGENTGRKGTQNEPTTGLGLILCKEFTEKNGGHIWAESEEGKGSTFYFTVPALTKSGMNEPQQLSEANL